LDDLRDPAQTGHGKHLGGGAAPQADWK